MISNLEIDLIKLYTEGTTEKWNAFLTDCLEKNQIERLVQTRKGLQIGAKTLANNKMNSPKMNEFFIRLNRSIEITAKKIIKKLHPD